MRTLTVSACRRPLYTHLVLSALAQCRGVDRYRVMVNIDAPPGPEFDSILRAVQPFVLNNGWTVNQTLRLGCNRAIVYCMDWGFANGGQFHVHLEDDTVPHLDFLRYHEWADGVCWHRPDVFSACAYNKQDGRFDRAYTRPGFTPWGWGTWRDRWDEARSLIDVTATLSWDCQMNSIRGSRVEVVPALGRTLNIGHRDGTYNTPDLWAAKQFNPVWAGSAYPTPDVDWWEIASEAPE